MVHLKQYEDVQPEHKFRQVIRRVSSWFSYGRYGLSFMLGKKEIFIGVTTHTIIVEPVIKRAKKIAKKGNVNIIDIEVLQGSD